MFHGVLFTEVYSTPKKTRKGTLFAPEFFFPPFFGGQWMDYDTTVWMIYLIIFHAFLSFFMYTPKNSRLKITST